MSPAAGAQSAPPPRAGDQAAANQAPATDEAEDKDEEPAIVVKGQPAAQRGAVIGDIPPEIQFSRAVIRSLGASSVSDVLDELAPEIRSGRGRGEAPVILVNGHRTLGFSEVRDIPAEAISRVDILPEEVALKYGYTANQRVVNIVLRKRFKAMVAEMRDGFSTGGGGNTLEPSLNYMHITARGRANLSLRYTSGDMLTEDARDIAFPVPGRPYALAGNVAASSGEIDPTLSALAGQRVTVAAVPALAALGAPGLADFVAGANAPALTDTRPYRSLLPQTDSFAANAIVNRQILGAVEATLNARLQLDWQDAETGLHGVSYGLPAGNPFSPFANDVTVYRYAPGAPAQRHTSDLAGHLGLNLNANIGLWNGTATASYDRLQNHVRAGGGLDTTGLETALRAGDPAVNPFADLRALPVLPRADDIARTDTDTATVDLTTHGTLARLPAGALGVTARVGGSWEALDSLSVRSDGTAEAKLSRQDLNAQASIDVPIASRRAGVLPWLGKLSANANVAVHDLSDHGTLRTYGFGLTWAPVQPLRIIASMTDEDGAPSLADLGAPVTTTPGVRVYDFLTGASAYVTRVDAGNPALRNDNRRVYKLGVTIRPEAVKGLSLTANYLNTRIRDGVAYPALATPAIEAAFPGLFTRDATGALTRLIRSPVNIARETREELRWGLNIVAGGGARHVISSGAVPSGAAHTQFQFSLYHNWRLHDEATIAPGLPPLDLLDGGALDATLGHGRHQVEARASMMRGMLGMRASVNWNAATRIDGATAASSLHFGDLATINLRLFINPGQQKAWLGSYPWLRGARLTLSLDNLADARARVTDGAGHTPPSYQPALLDPMGRTLRLSVRKVFY